MKNLAMILREILRAKSRTFFLELTQDIGDDPMFWAFVNANGGDQDGENVCGTNLCLSFYNVL